MNDLSGELKGSMSLQIISADNPTLELKTSQTRGFCQKVERMMKEEGLLSKVETAMKVEIKDLVPIRGKTQPAERLEALFTGVAEITREAIGHDFDTVINPCSGSDISAGLAFGGNLVTIDQGDLFAIHDKTDEQIKDRLERSLRGKLVTGMHGFYGNQGLLAYAMELVLQDVDLNTMQIVNEQKCGNVTATTVRFVKDGRLVEHTNFAHATLGKEFQDDKPEDIFVKDQVQRIIRGSNRPLVLSKAGGSGMLGSNITTTSFYPLLPEYTTIVSDVEEAQSLQNSGALITLSNRKTPDIEDKLNDL